MKHQPIKSIYGSISKQSKSRSLKPPKSETINIAKTVRTLRESKGLSGVSLCRMAGDLDPKTLTAVEKGRIVNPSVRTLTSIARGLGVTVGDLFREAELHLERNFHQGGQKGAFQLEFSQRGVKIVSFTPLIRDFFCGKLILSAKKKVTEAVLKYPQPVFVSSLVGHFEISLGNQILELKEGDNLFFNGAMPHTIQNKMHRESVLMLVTAPSFL